MPSAKLNKQRVNNAIDESTKVLTNGNLTGQLLGHYQIQDKLGQGGMGVVYKARDNRLGRLVAIKLLPSESIADPDRKRRFAHEARAASALNHPNIVTLYDIGQVQGNDFIAIEYVDGKTLDRLIRRKGMRVADALKYAVQISDALAAAHAAGIIHRDLKPGNVMVTEAGVVKVLDFGLAKLLEKERREERESTETVTVSGTKEGVILGTLSYMSPEQAQGKRLDTRSDIFSFGSLLYEMLTGQKAFQGDSKLSALSAILEKDPKAASEIRADIPRDLDKIITRCLRKDPSRRFQHMDDVKVALEEVKEDWESGALKTIEPRKVLPPGNLRWPAVVLAVAATVLAIAGWFWLNQSQPTPEESRLTAVPLTTYPGHEFSPSLSPDGTQVAFQWCQEGQNTSFHYLDACHIYIKQIGVEPASQFTNSATRDSSPAWSPDGQSIAFVRYLESKRCAVMLIPQRGGNERQLESWDLSKVSNPPFPPYLAWTPDSRNLVFPSMEEERKTLGLLLVSVETGAKRWLTTQAVGSDVDTNPAFSPNGQTLAFTRHKGSNSDVYLLRVGEGYAPQGEPEKVDTGNPVNSGPAWMPDGKELVISSGTLNRETLWRIQVSNAGKPIQLGLPSENGFAPSISRTGKRLVYCVKKYDSNIWRVDLRERGGMPGRPVPLIFSTKHEGGATYSADGKGIAFISERTGASEVWSCDSEGRNPAQLTSLGFAGLQGLSWSPDGQYIAFSGILGGSQEIYVVSAGGGRRPQGLTTEPGTNQWPSWSHDGRWIYFKNQPREGPPQIWKIPPQGGEATQITRTKDGIDTPQESPDDKFLYFARGWPFTLSIWKIPIEGGEETKVLDSVHANTRWILRQEGIYYVAAPDAKGTSDLCLLEFSTGRIRELFRISPNMNGDIALSPDERMFLYGQADEAGNDLMLVDNFH